MNAIAIQEETIRIPIGKIHCNLQTPIYRKKGENFDKCKEYLPMGTIKNFYKVNGNTVEIENGFYIKDIDRDQFLLTYGELEIVGNHVYACSYNGVILRKLPQGRIYNITSIQHVSDDVTIYGINNQEFISSDELVSFRMGTFIPSQEAIVTKEGSPVKIKKGEKVSFQRAENGEIQLLDGSWLNLQLVKGEIII